MDNYFNLPQWPQTGSIPSGMGNPWLPFGAFYDPSLHQSMGMTHNEQYQPQLQELKPVLSNLQSQPQMGHYQQPTMAGIENQPPFTPNNAQDVFSQTLSQHLNKTPATLLTPPSDQSAILSPSFLDSAERNQKRGQKRKKRGGKEDFEDNEEADESSEFNSPSQSLSHPNVFCDVTGRLSVVGQQRKYDVTVDEIFRRTGLPEGLNISHIGPLLRRGKVKGCGDELKDLLSRKGLDTTKEKEVNRKRFPLTTLSAFLEGEAAQFSEDHRVIAKDRFPFVDLSRLIISTIQSPTQLNDCLKEAITAQKSLAQMMSILGEWTTDQSTILNSPFKQFFLATHSLGVSECLTITYIFHQYLRVLEQELSTQLNIYRSAANSNPHEALMNPDKFPSNMAVLEVKKGFLHKPDIEEEARSSSSFAEIPGRLTLQNKKYNVTVGELLRRCRAPESLNLSIIGSALRKGKSKDNGNALRDDLAKHDIKIDQGRRKNSKITVFTPLLEGEAIALSEDIASDATKNFPLHSLVDEMLTRSCTNGPGTCPQIVSALRNGHNAVRRAAHSLSSLIRQLRLPVAERIPHTVDQRAHIIVDYCNLTHGYGPDACIAWLTIIEQIFDEASEILPRR